MQNQIVDDSEVLDFDPAALREKYREERDRRLRPDGAAQYVKPEGDFKHFVEDPYVEPGFARPTLNDQVEILIVGGGFGGLIAGALLRDAGFSDIRVVESGGDFGGTWYWNRYPGAQCDIESYIYMPLLEETGYIPELRYSFATEIREHAARIGKHFDLYKNALFQTQIKAMDWNDDDGVWVVSTDRDDRIRARYVIVSGGPLNRPKLPAIPGIDSYQGHTFHTSRWDYGYTGGDAEGGLTKLSDKRVAIIGTGATAIQCIPYLGEYAQQLYVFQRTPSSVDERNNWSTPSDFGADLKPGWQRRRQENFNVLISGGTQQEDLVKDGWTDLLHRLGPYAFGELRAQLTPEQLAEKIEIADFKQMNYIRDRVQSIVRDRATAEALKPWFRQMCKRPTFNDDYLETFNRPNVTLVDTHGMGVERISEKGLIVDGVEYEVDCIIFATGFEVETGYKSRVGFDIFGRDRKALSKHFEHGTRTLHGFYSHGFPNYFNLGLRQTGYKANFVDMLTDQAEHVARLLTYMRDHDYRRIEPTAEGEESWVRIFNEKASFMDDFLSQCTPGYYNAEGNVKSRGGLFGEAYGGGPLEFLNILGKWWATGRFEGVLFKA